MKRHLSDADITRMTDERNAELLAEYIKDAAKDRQILAKVVDDYLATGPSQTFVEAVAAISSAVFVSDTVRPSQEIQKAILTHLATWAKDEAPSVSEETIIAENI